MNLISHIIWFAKQSIHLFCLMIDYAHATPTPKRSLSSGAKKSTWRWVVVKKKAQVEKSAARGCWHLLHRAYVWPRVLRLPVSRWDTCAMHREYQTPGGAGCFFCRARGSHSLFRVSFASPITSIGPDLSHDEVSIRDPPLRFWCILMSGSFAPPGAFSRLCRNV